MDKRDWIIGIMSICIIVLMYAQIFQIPYSESVISESIINDDNVEPPPVMWRMVGAVIIVILTVLYIVSWLNFSIGNKNERRSNI